MPVVTSAPSINGHKYDFASLRFYVRAFRYFEVRDFSYKQSLAPGKVRGTSAKIRGRTRGVYDGTGSLTMYKAEYQLFIAQLAVTGPYMEQSFDVYASYAEAGAPIIKDTCLGIRIVDDEDSHSEGGDALLVKATLDIWEIRRGGLPAVSDNSLL